MADMNIPANDDPVEQAPAAKTSCALDSLGKNLTMASYGKKKTTHLFIPSVRFTKLIIHHLKTKHNIHPRTSLPLHYSHEEYILNTLRSTYYDEYQEHVAKYQQYLDAEHARQKKEEQQSLLKLPREPDPGRIQPLPDVQGKGKEKVIDEQAAHDLFTLLNPKNKSLVDQFIFQRRTPMPTEASGHVESPSLDAKLALIDSEMESDNIVSKINTGDQDEGLARPNPGNHDEDQVGPNPGVQDKGQAGSNPGDAAESQPQSSHVVHPGPNLEHMDLEATDASTQ
nr:hypothetical protein [Tanacetum cinerariifolium]